MTIQEILDDLDKSETNELHVDLAKMYPKAFKHNMEKGIIDNTLEHEITAYPMVTWIDEELEVGAIVYYLKKELIAISYKNARDEDEEFSWVSEAVYLKVKEYIENLCLKQDGIEIYTLNFNEEMGKGVIPSEIDHIHKYSYLFLDGKPVFVKGNNRVVNTVDVIGPENEVTTNVKLTDLIIGYNTNAHKKLHQEIANLRF